MVLVVVCGGVGFGEGGDVVVVLVRVVMWWW